MKEKKQLYCYINLLEKDNTISSGKKWKDIFVSYLVHILEINYNIQLILLDSKDQLDSLSIKAGFEHFLYLDILTNENNLSENSLSYRKECYASQFNKVEVIGIVKEPIEYSTVKSIDLRIFDFCLMDPETGTTVKSEEFFGQDYFTFFLIRISDLAFEIDFLFYNNKEKNIGSIYLAEAPCELLSVRYSVKKELICKGYKVLPEVAFPSESNILKLMIQEDLKKSTLSVHFFGSNISTPHPVTGLSMDVYQNNLAADFYKESKSSVLKGEQGDSDFSRIIWMPENVRIKNEKQGKFVESLKHEYDLYAGADFIRSSPEDLKDIILKKMKGIKNSFSVHKEKDSSSSLFSNEEIEKDKISIKKEPPPVFLKENN
ncbi:MAG TPA: hypothetical protein VK766_01940 [Cytophagaceae bacterium]|nr:hypothetical protein [Cytophagaceae bacterium]